LYSQGNLKVKETVTEGFDNMATAFLDLFKGGNTGKAIIKA
jgi:prostaglandin reductase 1